MKPLASSKAARFSIALLLASCCLTAAIAQPDTLVVCAGEVATLNAPPGRSAYEWVEGPGVVGRRTSFVSVVPSTTTTYVVRSRAEAGPELVVNGGFEAGNQDFTTDYRFAPAGSLDQGTYAILQRASAFNIAFANCTDQTAPNGLMYIADGSTINGDRAWCQTITGLTPGTEYAFSAAVTSLVSANPPRLAFSINGTRLQPTIAAGATPCDWQNFYALWQAPAGTGSVELCIENINTAPNGNDFALDAVSFIALGAAQLDTIVARVVAPVRDTLAVVLCSGERYTENGLSLRGGQSGTATLTSNLGCDSLLTVQATQGDTTFAELRTDTLCPGDILTYNNFVISSDTVLCEQLTSSTGCDSVFCLTVKYLNISALNFSSTAPTCFGESDGSLSVQASAGVPPYMYRWGDGNTSAVRQGIAAGNYQVTVTDARGCQASNSALLVDPEPIRILQAFPYDTRCNGEPTGGVILTGIGGSGTLTTVPSDSTGDLASDALAAGRYSVRLQDTLGCFVELDSMITISEPTPVSVVVSGPQQIRLGNPTTHSASIIGDSITVSWTFAGTPIDSLVQGDQLQWVPTGIGILQVKVVDAFGCQDQSRLLIEVIDPALDLFPNAFSPNADGSNDSFGPMPDPSVLAVREFHVFDRWGNELFSRLDCRPGIDGLCHWDGATRAGEPLETGVYVYYARLELIDGREFSYVGDVHLVGRRAN